MRPTADRVREALFAALHARAGDLSGWRVLDVFAGTGALGIEALSRGAAEAVFVEQAPAVVSVLRSNLAALDLLAAARVVKADARSALRRLARAGERYELVLLDPPYGSDLVSEVLDALPGLLAAGGEAWLETDRRDPLPRPPGLVILDARRYGDTVVTRLGADAPAGEDAAPGAPT